jgi:predicted nucleotidyltransferase component of viral defense system
VTKYASDLTDFPDLLQATAQWRKLPAAIVEKDYYLCRALRALAEGHNGQFILKGGTSLSKGWQLLQRFSEDIDLLVRPTNEPGKGTRHRRLKRLAETCSGGFQSEEVRDSETGVHRTVGFTYPSVATDLPSRGRTVILEAGYRGNAAEAATRQVDSIVAQYASARGHIDLAADLTAFELEVQNLQRTFVEKLFAAHAAYEENRAANGKARHYYDLYEMCRLTDIQAFVGTDQYRKCVAEVREFSKHTFPNQAAPDTDSFAESAAFRPGPDGLRALENNYKNEAELFFAGQPSLADVLHTIGKLLPQL